MGEIYLKRLLLFVFFSLILSACGSDKQTDAYDRTPETEITSQPMQVDDSVLQPELNEQLDKLSGYWETQNNLGMIVRFDNNFLTLVDTVSGEKHSFFSHSVTDFGRMMTFVAYDSTSHIESVNINLDIANSGQVESFTITFDQDVSTETNFVKANTSHNYQELFAKASL